MYCTVTVTQLQFHRVIECFMCSQATESCDIWYSHNRSVYVGAQLYKVM